MSPESCVVSRVIKIITFCRKMSGMRVSEFMLQLIQSLIKERDITESSANQYLQTLHSLNDKKPFSNLAWLKNTAAVEKVLEGYAPATQRGYTTAIVSALSLFKEKPTYKKVYKYWYDKMMASRKTTDESGEKSEKQSANWIDWNEVQRVKGDLRTEALKVKDSKHITPAQLDFLLKYVVLSLYTDVPPRRNADYADMYVVKKWKEDMDKTKNYLDLATRQFIFNKYKTAKTYGEQRVSIPNDEDKPLMDIINLYLKHHPLNRPKVGEYKFLVLRDGSMMNSVNGITRILNKIFGKKIGSSMLRHIYLTGKYGTEIAEMKKDSDEMAHSLGQQKAYVLHDAPTISHVE